MPINDLPCEAFTHLVRPGRADPNNCAENANKAARKNPVLDAQLVKKVALVPSLLGGQIPGTYNKIMLQSGPSGYLFILVLLLTLE